MNPTSVTALEDALSTGAVTGQPQAAVAREALQKAFGRLVSDLGELSEVERIIKSKLHAEAPLLTEVSEYLLQLGGKRVRPVLAVVAAKLCAAGAVDPRVLQVAAGIELIHMATLLHDDIIDHSLLRRHKPSPLARFGASNTLLAGDFLLTRAFSLCAHLDRVVIDATEQACINLTEGEILEVPFGEQPIPISHTIDVAARKTAALFRLATFSGAHLSGVTPEIVSAMSDFGQNLGIAFQILDDILDVTSTAETLGKAPGTDIRERKPSAVNVLWLESGSSRAKRLLCSITEGGIADAEIAAALTEIKDSNVLDEAASLAGSFARKALDALNAANAALGTKADLESYRALRVLVDFCLSRSH